MIPILDDVRTERDPRDFYPTPEWAVSALYREFPQLPQPTLDPCAGIGSLLAPVGRFGYRPVRGIELDPELAHEAGRRGQWVIQGDGLAASWRGENILMNPPYKDAQTWIQKGIDEAASVCALLRLGFLASRKRSALLRRNPPHGLGVLSKRPSFRWGRTDSSEYGWFIWLNRPNPSGTVIRWLLPEAKS